MNTVGSVSTKYIVCFYIRSRVQTFRRTISQPECNALLFENYVGGLNEFLLYEILRSELILVFFVPHFHFFILFFTPTGNAYRWKAVKEHKYVTIFTLRM